MIERDSEQKRLKDKFIQLLFDFFLIFIMKYSTHREKNRE